MKVSNTADRLNYLLRERNIKQVDLLRMVEPYCIKYDTKISKSQISEYLKGTVEPKQDKLYVLAQTLNVSEAWLMGLDVPMQKETIDYAKMGLRPVTKKSFPVLGSVACGLPVYMGEEREFTMIEGEDIDADFVLFAKGDSMVNARINDGDAVFIKKQPTVENGEIAVVSIEDEATLKRVYHDRPNQILTLVAENPAYPPMVFSGPKLDEIKILGKAVAFQSPVR